MLSKQTKRRKIICLRNQQAVRTATAGQLESHRLKQIWALPLHILAAAQTLLAQLRQMVRPVKLATSGPQCGQVNYEPSSWMMLEINARVSLSYSPAAIAATI